MSKNIDDRLSVFTFITANPMRVYWSEKAGEPKSSCVRVVYSLEEKKDGDKNEPRYELYRQEGTDLDFGLYSKKESKFEPYLIADNIVSCKLTFIVADEKQEEKEDSLDEKKQPAKPESKKAAKPVIEIKEFKDWTTNKDQKDVRTRLMLPDTVIMTLKLSNPSNTRERSFTFRVPVAARFHEVPIQEPPKTVPGLADKPAAGKSDEDKSLADTSKKEVFVENANKIVQNLRTKFGRA